jgi:diguanylate cyclase (GGDEF)-like protein/PAS domain S-box-containing protein
MAAEEARVVDPATLEASVFADQIQILCHGLTILSFNFVNAAIVAFVLRGFFPASAIAVALTIFGVVVFARIYDAWRFRRAERSIDETRAFATRYTIGSIVNGSLWGAATVMAILTTPDPAYHAFVIFVSGGMAAGAVISNSAYLPAMLGFAAPAALPAIAALALRGEPLSIAMAALLTAFTVVLGIMGRRANGWLISNSRRRLVQEALAAALHQRNALLHAISTAAAELTRASPHAATIPELLAAVGAAVGVDRIPVFEVVTQGRKPALSLLHLWRSAEAPAARDSRALTAEIARNGMEEDPFLATLGEGRPATALPRTLATGPARSFFEGSGVLSVLLVPIEVDDTIWGAIGFEDCRKERVWTAVEIDALRTLGDLVGGAIVRQRHVDELRDANEVVERSPTILFRISADAAPRLDYVSRNIALLGYDPSQLIGPARRLAARIHPEDRDRVQASLARALTDDGRAGMVEFRFRQKDGGYRWLDARYAPGRGGHPRLVEGVALDVTERREAAERINRLARTDALTDLANRRAFIEALQRVFAAALRNDQKFSLLYIDVDRFKNVNDTMGHAVGDALLEALAARLRSHCRASDVVARLGGDEFAVLQNDLRDGSDAVAMASKIQGALSTPYSLPIGDLRVTVCVGVAIYAPETADPDMMLAQADKALYHAKAEGRNQFRLYSQALDKAANDRSPYFRPAHATRP